MDGGGGSIEVSKELSLRVTEPAIIEVAEANLDLSNGGSTQINELSSVRLDFEVPLPLDSGCKIHIALPDDFTNLR